MVVGVTTSNLEYVWVVVYSLDICILFCFFTSVSKTDLYNCSITVCTCTSNIFRLINCNDLYVRMWIICFHECSVYCVCLVVQVFNAVNKQQKDLEEKLQKVGPSERKRSKSVYVCMCMLWSMKLLGLGRRFEPSVRSKVCNLRTFSGTFEPSSPHPL